MTPHVPPLLDITPSAGAAWRGSVAAHHITTTSPLTSARDAHLRDPNDPVPRPCTTASPVTPRGHRRPSTSSTYPQIGPDEARASALTKGFTITAPGRKRSYQSLEDLATTVALSALLTNTDSTRYDEQQKGRRRSTPSTAACRTETDTPWTRGLTVPIYGFTRSREETWGPRWASRDPPDLHAPHPAPH